MSRDLLSEAEAAIDHAYETGATRESVEWLVRVVGALRDEVVRLREEEA